MLLMVMPPPSELELIKLQYEGTFDERSRIRDFYGVRIAIFAGRQTLSIGADVPDALAGELAAAFEHSPAATQAAPPALETCRALLAAGGAPLPLRTSMNYLVEDEIAVLPRIEAHIVRSDAPQTNALRNANPGNWEPVEWDELLDGHLGLWVMAIDGGRVASLCHTPKAPSARAAECGVWTHPDFRGRGYAATVTSEWIALMRPSCEYLFYSTLADNRSSQQVARRLGLRPIGSTWRLGRGMSDEEQRIHPLSVLRRHR
jgi:RimJ/RimL family protein N-acetyltransferase